MDKVTVYFNSTLAHFSQLFTGLESLKEKEKIELNYEMELKPYPADVCRIEYNGLSVFFDMADNSGVREKILNGSDFYVKRMLLKNDFEDNKKLLPFGLNYSVFLENDFMKYLFLKRRFLLKYSLKYSKAADFFLDINDSIANNHLRNMAGPPVQQKQMIFRSRLWNPANNETQWKKEERKILNEERITIIRNLKEKYKQNFFGGINRDEYAETECSDLLLSENQYHKKIYLKLLKASSIGIVNQGLENSIGWKLGEYVSHSMAIVSNPIEKYKLLGDFIEGKNYLVYRNVEECLEKVELLYTNDKLRREMQEANRKYYNDFLHPGVKMQRIFDEIKSRS